VTVYTFADVQGFAGGFSCAATLAGFRLVAKREHDGGFGAPLMEANRKFLGDGWQTQTGPAESWDPVTADVVIANPPCSAFSGMTSGQAVHGSASRINDCMWDVMHFAARVKPAFVCMESVSQAFVTGLPLMRALAHYLRRESGLDYQITHVLQNNLATGGCTQRKRYFLVLSLEPFGVELPDLHGIPTVGDALSDLRNLPLTWDEQPVTSEPSWWTEPLRREDGLVDGHQTVRNTQLRNIHGMITGEHAVPWEPGDKEDDVIRRYHETHGEMPPHVTDTKRRKLLETNFKPGGFSNTRYWDWSRPGHVLTGAGPSQVWHPDGRFITHREAARIMGFPDSWLVGEAASQRNLGAYWGKGTSVSPAKWLMTWVRHSLEGDPGSLVGTLLPTGDRLIDVSMHHKRLRPAATS
jgi:site-specific DNA-cytosine methylase